MIRFKPYVCESPLATRTSLNPDGCIYAMRGDNCEYCGVSFEDSCTIWYKMYRLLPYWLRQNHWRNAKRLVRFFFQRRRRGFDESELWSLYSTIARFVEPRLRAFIDTYEARSYPCDLTPEEWRSKLEKMHRAFVLITQEDGAMFMLKESELAEVEEGLDLFRVWFTHLWD